MTIYGDYHTHSVYSHGKGTIRENVQKAVECGLKEIAVTDHGFRHMAYNVRRIDFGEMRKDVEAVRREFPDINIYLGLETNLTGLTGEIDIKPTDMPQLDILLCGFHKFVFPNRLNSIIDFYIPVFWSNILKNTSRHRIIKNTEAYVNAIIKNDIDVITHLNFGIVSNPVEVAKAAAHYGTFIELNGKHINFSDREIEQMIETGVSFIIDSDAHSVDKIGNYDKQLEVVRRVNIPEAQIANLGKKPEFRSQRNKQQSVK